MEALLLKIGPFLEQGSFILMVVVIVATVIARITPTPKDDKVVDGVGSFLLKLIQWLPTFGVNPKTKKLEEAYKKLKDVKNSKPS